jgi:signal transduction histidine kinase
MSTTTLPGLSGSVRAVSAVAARLESLRWRLHPVDVLWPLFAVSMFVVMYLIPAQQTIPYHFIFVSFTLLYGYRLWPVGVTIGILITLTVIPGLMFVRVYATGDVPLDELAEVPLMPLIVGGMAWHAHRSAAARRQVEELAARESSRLARQVDFLRDTAHAIRTPVTIARGHIELMQLDSADLQWRADADEVLHQLDRMHAMARRLLVIEALQTTEQTTPETVDARRLVADVGRRWSHSAPRNWVVQAASDANLVIDKLRLEEALDALVENALRFTGSGDTVRLSGLVDDGWVRFVVADSGPGIDTSDRERVFERFFHRQPVGEEPGTGLGLALVAAVADAFGGSASAGRAPEGGALLTLRLPRA